MSPENRCTSGSPETMLGSDESFRLLAESVEDYSIILLDQRGFITSWNRGAVRHTGFQRDEILGRHFSCLFPREAQEGNFPKAALDAAARDGRFESEGWRARKDGTQFWANAVITALKHSDGTVLGFAKVTRDLTVRRNDEVAFRARNVELDRRLCEQSAALSVEHESFEKELARRKRAEREMEHIFEISLEMICFAGQDGYFKRLNPLWETVLGFSREELCSRPFIEFIHPDDRAATLAEIEKMNAGVDVVHFENRYLHKDGSYRWLAWKAPAPPPGQDYLYATARDMTEKKQVEARIARMIERLDLATHAARLGIWDWDIVRNELVWDDRMYELYGVRKEDFSGAYDAWLKGVHPDDRASCDAEIQKALRGEKEYDIDFRVLWPDGTVRVIKADSQVIRDAAGTPVRMTGINRDITDHKRAEQRVALQLAVSGALAECATLEEATPRLVEAIAQSVNARVGAIWLVDPAAQVLRCVSVWHQPGIDVSEFETKTRAITFASGRGLPGRVWQTRKPVWIPDVADEADFPRAAVAAIAGLHAAFAVPILSHENCLGIVEFFSAEIHAPDAELLEVCRGIGRQIGQFTERKRAEERLAQLTAEAVERAAQLEAANKELEAFSYSVSHDLRAPLRHVQGYVEMLKKAAGDQLPEKARGHLKVISDSSRQMGQLIDDLLAFSRIGRTEMARTTVQLDELVQLCRQALELETRGRRIDWKIAPLPAVVGDRAMLRQVFANLIGNAVKYTAPRDPAEIEIGSARGEGGEVVFFIKDNGVGFDMRYAHKLFGVFQRLHTTAEFEGTGIGLANVRRIIMRHGGRIWPQAAPGEGATFFFTLEPAPPGSQPPPQV